MDPSGQRAGGAQMGLGLAALGRPAYINVDHGSDVADPSREGMERLAHAVLDAAYAAGVRWFDAARSYGEAEAFLGSWLEARGLGAADLIVSSKWGYAYTAGWRRDAEVNEVKDLSAAQLRRQWPETRERLDGALALYQIHSATAGSGVLEDPEVRALLAEIRASGVRIGFSATGSEQAETIERALDLGGFDAVQATWNLHERAAERALARAHDAGLTVLVKEGVANGRLTGRAAPAALAAAARERGSTPDALALAAILARPWVDVVLSGATTVEHLRSNLAARDVAWDEALEAELAGLAEDSETYWETRAALPWT